MNQSEVDGQGARGTIGGEMKEAVTAHWKSPNSGVTNSSGFSALPGGLRTNSGSFNVLGDFGNWWSSSEGTETSAWSRELFYFSDGMSRYVHAKSHHGFSVRCIKD